MLIACASDAHGAKEHMLALLTALPRIDAFCFLGDCERDAHFFEYALAEAQPPALFLAVAGNNDFGSQLPGTIEWTFGNTHALLTHGHLFRVKMTRTPLAQYTRGRGCVLTLFGHTHRPEDTLTDDVRLVNPGALANGQWALITLGERIDVALRTL